MAAVITTTYAASATVFGSTDLDSLASSSTWVAGWESAVIDNTTNMYVDALLSGRFKANNTAPTAGQICVYVGAVLNDTPTYPDMFDGTSSAETVTSADIRNSILRLAAVITTDATSNRIYEFAPTSVAALFGGVMPLKWWVFVSHSMVQALNATASNGGQCWYQGIKYTST
jgi:hypothetical protein